MHHGTILYNYFVKTEWGKKFLFTLTKFNSMKEKHFLLMFAIVMAVVTTCVILLLFATLEVSSINLGLISLVSILGYLSSAAYYYSYKEVKQNQFNKF